MGNLVIKSNTANRTFNIEQKVFKLPFDKKVVEIFITAKEPYSIDAKDFNHGVLPGLISKILFINSGPRIIARVSMKNKIKSNMNIVLDLPIFGKSKRKVDTFDVVETVSSDVGVIVSGYSSSQKSMQNEETTYSVNNDLGKKLLVLSKTFTIANKFKFSQIPTYTISGNASRFNVITSVKRDRKNIITSKTFDFYYTSPDVITERQDTSIDFLALSKDYTPGTARTNTIASEENVIYSIDSGRNIGPEGGNKRIVVRGMPGSAYEFVVSNSTGLMYNIENGIFSDTGSAIKGVLGDLVSGKSYSEAIVTVRVPRSATGDTISTQFINQESTRLQQARLSDATNPAEFSKIQGEGVTRKTKNVSLILPTLSFNVTTDIDTLTSTSVVAAESEGVSTQAVTLTVDDGSGGSSAATDVLFLNKKIYKSDGTFFGTCTSVSATSLVFGAGLSSAIADNDVLHAFPTTYLGRKVKTTDVAGATITSQAIFLGKEGRQPLGVTRPRSYSFSFSVSALTANKLVQITRQPLFVMPTDLTDNYVSWDAAAASETNKANAVNSSGTSIVSDWDWVSVEKGVNVAIKAKAAGNGKILKTTSVGGVDKYAFSEVIVRGEIRVGSVGDKTSSLALNLNNFLSIV
tara:strand:+ start:1664 stop:3562 length:1899 start_codon:yes stop_codon:yes gene_type:complete